MSTGPVPSAARTVGFGVLPADVTAQLTRVLESDVFAKAPVLRRLLQFIVERTLDGRTDEIKEYTLGVDVFERGGNFDPRTDTIVRVQARRLRTKLEEYYEGPGRGDRVIIELPKGSYVVCFRPSSPRGAIASGDHLMLVTKDLEAISALPRATPLPAQRTPLIGRDTDIVNVRRMLLRDDVRLFILTGAGGSGKTRLALQVASEAEQDFHGGVYFIALGSVTEENGVGREIAHALGLRQTDGRPLVDALLDHVRLSIRDATLLVLDNFEQVIGAGPLLVALLDACAALKILVTSRALLRVSGEFSYSVPPLSVPQPADRSSQDVLTGNAAVTLFVQRAAAIEPSFTLNDENSEAIADICVRLDGLPLALELAAARIRVLTPAQICARLKSRLDLLTGGASDLPARQQTLRNTLEWSHALLSADEQRLFRRLSVFAGGWTLESAEAVCNPSRDLGIDVLDGITSLLDKSLIYQIDQSTTERRFAMLETVRELAREQLDAHGEANLVRRAHAAYSVVLAEEVAFQKTPTELADWLAKCDAERANHRAAIAYLVESHDASWALRIGVALYRYWEHREYLAEGRACLEAILAMPAAADRTLARARALGYGAALASIQGDHDVAIRRQIEALEVYRELGDKRGIVAQLNALAACERWRGNYQGSRERSEETLGALRELGDRAAIAAALSNLGRIAILLGSFDEAKTQLEAAAAMFGALGDSSGVAWCNNHLGDLALELRQLAEARRFYEEGARIFQSMGNRWGLARSACDLGHLACEEGDHESAQQLFEDALLAFGELGHKRGTASALEGLARLAADRSKPARALALAGAAAALRRATGSVARWEEDRKMERTRDLASEQCPPELASRMWAAGSQMPIDEVIRYALANGEEDAATIGSLRDPGADAPPRRDRRGAPPAGRVPR
jgi:predicted ATPase